MNNKSEMVRKLLELSFSVAEAKVYLALLEKPSTHLELSRTTGVNRSKIYRIVDDMKKRGLISATALDDGKRLVASSPENLEILLTNREQALVKQRLVLDETLPHLSKIFEARPQQSHDDFSVNTYDGIDGFKQMLWNELKTNHEILVFGHGNLEELVADHNWSERYRTKAVTAGYEIRELLNPGAKKDVFTDVVDYMQSYHMRLIATDVLPLHHQTAIYNDTVAIYNWSGGHRVGLEIIKPPFADMMRQMFEHYWSIASPREVAPLS